MSNKSATSEFYRLRDGLAAAVSGLDCPSAVSEAVQALSTSNCQVVTSGMGKAGLIARKMASTLSCTGTPAIYLHPAEAQHGDLGVIGRETVMVLFSNSGETRECIELCTLADNLLNNACGMGKRLFVVLVTSKPDSTIGRMANIVIDTGVTEEICPLGLTPTSSAIAMLAVADIISVMVMTRRGITAEDYALRHHGGYLGAAARLQSS